MNKTIKERELEPFRFYAYWRRRLQLFTFRMCCERNKAHLVTSNTICQHQREVKLSEAYFYSVYPA
jgi:hypothetical protein